MQNCQRNVELTESVRDQNNINAVCRPLAMVPVLLAMFVTTAKADLLFATASAGFEMQLFNQPAVNVASCSQTSGTLSGSDVGVTITGHCETDYLNRAGTTSSIAMHASGAAGVFFDASGAGDFGVSTGLSFLAENVTYPADPALIFLPTFALTERMTLGAATAVGVSYDNMGGPAFNLIISATLTASASFFPISGAFREEFRATSNLGGGAFSLFASNAADSDGVADGVYHYSASHGFPKPSTSRPIRSGPGTSV